MRIGSILAIVASLSLPASAFALDPNCTAPYTGVNGAGFGCPVGVMCRDDRRSPIYCFTEECGSSSCTSCPSIVPEPLTRIVFESWCSLKCWRQTSMSSRVPAGFAIVLRSSLAHKSIGPYCFVDGDILPTLGNDGWGTGVP